MLLGVIADDFTGASDVANALAAEGMRTRLFVSTGGATEGCDAGVVALKTRSVPSDEAVRRSLDALERLRGAGCRQILFKYCSTFDSTPEGNIGPVAEALMQALGASRAIVCPAFPANGRTVYQGHLFVRDRLLSESGMERHALTPMTDPDIRRWLARQTDLRVGHVGLATVRAGAEALRMALKGMTGLIVVDAVDEADLRAIGAACADDVLLTGGSGVALGLPTNFGCSGAASAFRPASGPALILSGSCSAATRMQVEAYAHRPRLKVDVDALLAGEPVREAAQAFAAARRNEAPLIHASADAERVRATQERHGQAQAAEAVESFFADMARWAVANGFERIVSAGGETSGAVVGALSLEALDLGPEIAPGVPALSVPGRPLALALKSGNFGGPDFFETAVRMLGHA